MHRYLLDIPLWGRAHLRIPSYGTMLAIGALAGMWLAARRARKAGFSKETVVDMGVMMVLWGVVGARIFFVLENYEYFFTQWHPGKIFAIWEGGLVFYGGFIAALLFLIYHFTWGKGKKEKGGAGDFMDLAAPSVGVALGFTRIGCFLNGCCYGQPTSCPIAVRYPPGSIFHQEVSLPGTWVYERFHELAQKAGMFKDGAWSLPVHPTQLYSSAFGFVLGGFLYWYWPRRKGRGDVAGLFLVFYSIFRFSIETIRVNPPTFPGIPLSISQWISIPGFLFGVWLLLVSRGILPSPVNWLGPEREKERETPNTPG